METSGRPSRREFIKGVGLTVGAGALGSYPTELSGAAPRSSPNAMPPSVFPELNDRALAWLQFL